MPEARDVLKAEINPACCFIIDWYDALSGLLVQTLADNLSTFCPVTTQITTAPNGTGRLENDLNCKASLVVLYVVS